MIKETSYNVEQLQRYVAEFRPLLNEDQRAAHSVIMESIRKNVGTIIFLDAPGGTGKTFLLNLILAEVRACNQVAVAVASSGIAATLLAGGRTAHSTFKLPLNLARIVNPTCNIQKTGAQSKVLQNCRLIVWDECTMAHKKSLEALDLAMRNSRSCDDSIGGVVLVLSGDFRKTLPVIPRSSKADEIDACLKKISVMATRPQS